MSGIETGFVTLSIERKYEADWQRLISQHHDGFPGLRECRARSFSWRGDKMCQLFPNIFQNRGRRVADLSSSAWAVWLE